MCRCVPSALILIHPLLSTGLVLSEFLRFEPQGDLLVRWLDRVTAMHDVSMEQKTCCHTLTSQSSDKTTYRPTWIDRSPLIVPGAEFCGFVSPSIFLPVSTTFRPSHTWSAITNVKLQFMKNTRRHSPWARLVPIACTSRDPGKRALMTDQRNAFSAAHHQPNDKIIWSLS